MQQASTSPAVSADDNEFRRGWPVVAAAAMGTACGASPIPFQSIGSFVAPLSEEFGWGRGDIQLALLWFTLAVVVMVPIIGGLADKYGVRRVAILSLIAFGGFFSLIALTPANIYGFYLLFALAGALGGGSTPVTWTRGVNSWFFRRRGLALALMLSGTGLTAVVLPTIAVWLIDTVGWRLAYVGLGMIPLLIALPIVLTWFREPKPGEVAAASAAAATTGMTVREALRDYRFWVIAVSILFIAACVAGMITNLQPLLVDRGFTRAEAAGVAGAIGVSLLVGRIVAGWLIDHFWAPLVTLPLLLLPAIACLILTNHTIPTWQAIAAASMIGLAAGAETDLVAFLSARYFGLKYYGRIYGLQYSVFGFASGIAPAIFGWAYDATGSYDTILYAGAAMLAFGAFALLTLGRYPDFNRGHSPASQ